MQASHRGAGEPPWHPRCHTTGAQACGRWTNYTRVVPSCDRTTTEATQELLSFYTRLREGKSGLVDS
jgi:hypothetical protein